MAIPSVDIILAVKENLLYRNETLITFCVYCLVESCPQIFHEQINKKARSKRLSIHKELNELIFPSLSK